MSMDNEVQRHAAHISGRKLFPLDFWTCVVVLLGNLYVAITQGDWGLGVLALFTAVYMVAWYDNGKNAVKKEKTDEH